MPANTPTIRFAGLDFNPLTLAQTLDWLAARSAADPLQYIVTPNVDHIVRLDDNPGWAELHAAYHAAALRLCDSRVIRLLAKARGLGLPVVTGSDLTARFLRECLPAERSLMVVGGDDALGRGLRALLPGVAVSQHQPPMGLLTNDVAITACIAAVIAAQADYILISVGSPQQEIVAHRLAADPRARGTALCIGASLDFLTGKVRRAPRWMQRLALEWLYRLLSDPRRLWKRYLIDGPRIFRIALAK